MKSIKAPRGARVIDAKGKYVMPGGIDPHTHLEMSFMGQVACDDFFSGQASALAGGTTMHIDFALPTNGDLLRGFENYKVASDMETLTMKGINSFKFFMAYKGALMVTDEQLLNGLQKCKEIGALPQVLISNNQFLNMSAEYRCGMPSEKSINSTRNNRNGKSCFAWAKLLAVSVVFFQIFFFFYLVNFC
ncbi:hypothetical protein BSKO_13889 [Bryopsis sp. KO-2023]|nr:hypothetical protein BSKO_13889 [Bryopsis sp. KO-2023]